MVEEKHCWLCDYYKNSQCIAVWMIRMCICPYTIAATKAFISFLEEKTDKNPFLVVSKEEQR